MDDAVRLVTTFGGIQEEQLTHATLVMTGDDGDNPGWLIGDGAGEEHRVRPIGVRAGVFPLARAVRVHGHEQAVPDMGRVGVIPAQVKHATVVQYARSIVVVLLEGKLVDALPMRSHLE